VWCQLPSYNLIAENSGGDGAFIDWLGIVQPTGLPPAQLEAFEDAFFDGVGVKQS
jgi:hypothetical protein